MISTYTLKKFSEGIAPEPLLWRTCGAPCKPYALDAPCLPRLVRDLPSLNRLTRLPSPLQFFFNFLRALGDMTLNNLLTM